MRTCGHRHAHRQVTQSARAHACIHACTRTHAHARARTHTLQPFASRYLRAGTQAGCTHHRSGAARRIDGHLTHAHNVVLRGQRRELPLGLLPRNRSTASHDEQRAPPVERWAVQCVASLGVDVACNMLRHTPSAVLEGAGRQVCTCRDLQARDGRAREAIVAQ